MKKYTVARARQHLADVLDQAEDGLEVVIERRGVRFAVRPLAKSSASQRQPRVAFVDPAVEAGAWSWSRDDDGRLGFHAGGTDKP